MKDLARYGLPWVVLIVFSIFGASIWNGRIEFILPLFPGLIAVYYFNLNNRHEAYKWPVTIAFLMWWISFQVKNFIVIETWIIATAAAVFGFMYFQRFKARTETKWIDYLKLISVIALVPSTYLDLLVAPVFTLSIFLALSLLFMLDRLIIRKQMNKLTQIITFCGLTLICLSFMIYSFIKADEAEKLRIEAEAQRLHEAEFSSTLQNSINEITIELKRQEAINLELREAIDLCNSNK